MQTETGSFWGDEFIFELAGARIVFRPEWRR